MITVMEFCNLIPSSALVEVYDHMSNKSIYKGAYYSIPSRLFRMTIADFKIFANSDSFTYRLWV